MLTAAILYVLAAYPNVMCGPYQCGAYDTCLVVMDKPYTEHPKGFELVGEACDYIMDPYLPEDNQCEL